MNLSVILETMMRTGCTREQMVAVARAYEAANEQARRSSNKELRLSQRERRLQQKEDRMGAGQ